MRPQRHGRPVPHPGRGSVPPGRGSVASGRGSVASGRREPTSALQRGGIGGEQVEGIQAVRELLVAHRRRVVSVTISDPTGRSIPLAEIAELASHASYTLQGGAEAGVQVRYVDRHDLERLAESDSPQGVVAFAEAFEGRELASLVHREPGQPPPFLVVLDGVTDPHNLGAVMRSALGAGATGLVIPKHRSARLTPAALKAAAGAAEHLPLIAVAGVPAALRQLDQAGLWTVGLDSSGPTGIWDLAISDEPLALVLGAEGGGLSSLTVRRCRVLASIPLAGPLGSLNVSVAAAIACFEVARRRAGNR